MHNLAQVLLDRFELTGDQGDLDEAVAMSRRALQLTGPDEPARATFLTGLGQALGTRYNLRGAVDHPVRHLR